MATWWKIYIAQEYEREEQPYIEAVVEAPDKWVATEKASPVLNWAASELVAFPISKEDASKIALELSVPYIKLEQ